MDREEREERLLREDLDLEDRLDLELREDLDLDLEEEGLPRRRPLGPWSLLRLLLRPLSRPPAMRRLLSVFLLDTPEL